MMPSKCERIGGVVDTTLMLGLMEMVMKSGRRYRGDAQKFRDAKSH